jgi:hypothetical protein
MIGFPGTPLRRILEEEVPKRATSMLARKLTENNGIKASVGHIFIHKYFLMFVQANTNKSHKIPVVKLGN